MMDTSTDYGGVHGFKNGAPAHPNNSWSEVQLFLDTWGFLPGDSTKLETLKKEQLIQLCIYALSASCRIDIEGKGVKIIQEVFHEYGIAPEGYEEQKKEREKEVKEGREIQAILDKTPSRQVKRELQRELQKIGRTEFIEKHQPPK